MLGLLTPTFDSVRQVILSDYDPGCLSLLQTNIELNSNAYPIPMSKCSVIEYKWGTNPNTLLSCTQDGYDLVIGSDLLYCVEIVSPLFTSVSQLLKADLGLFILVSSFDTGEVSAIHMQAHSYTYTICVYYLLIIYVRSCFVL